MKRLTRSCPVEYLIFTESQAIVRNEDTKFSMQIISILMTARKIAVTAKPAKTGKSTNPARGCMSAFSGKAKTLAALVSEYQKLQEERSTKTCNPIRSMMACYRELPDLMTAIVDAAYAHDLIGKRYQNGQQRSMPKRHGHQRRLKKADMTKALKRLQSKASELESAKSFIEIYDCVSKICKPIDGLGKLYVYDTALRIGAFMKLKPKRVYLQAGALAGARALSLDVKNSPLPVKDFPKPLHELEPYEIEDFLCVCKGQLEAIKI